MRLEFGSIGLANGARLPYANGWENVRESTSVRVVLFSARHICVFKSFIQSFIHLFAGFLKRAFRIDGVFHFFDGFVDALTGLFSRPLFPAGND